MAPQLPETTTSVGLPRGITINDPFLSSITPHGRIPATVNSPRRSPRLVMRPFTMATGPPSPPVTTPPHSKRISFATGFLPERTSQGFRIPALPKDVGLAGGPAAILPSGSGHWASAGKAVEAGAPEGRGAMPPGELGISTAKTLRALDSGSAATLSAPIYVTVSSGEDWDNSKPLSDPTPPAAVK